MGRRRYCNDDVIATVCTNGVIITKSNSFSYMCRKTWEGVGMRLSPLTKKIVAAVHTPTLILRVCSC